MADVLKKIHKISLPTGFPVGDVNVYIIKDDPVTLIDTGVNGTISEHILYRNLKHIGLDFDDIKRIIITHTHLDHCGMAGRLQELCNTKVLVFDSKIEELKNFNQYFLKKPRALKNFYRESAVPERIFSRNIRNHQKSIYLGCSVQSPSPMNESTEIKTANFNFKIIHTPGHSEDIVCIYDEEKKILFSSDHLTLKMSPPLILGEVFEEESGNYGNLSEYLTSLDKLGKIDICYTLPGHGESFLEPSSVITKIKETYNDRKEFLAKVLKKGTKNRFELTRTLFGSLHEREIFKGIPEVTGHLNMLEREDRLTKWIENGIIYYAIKH